MTTTTLSRNQLMSEQRTSREQEGQAKQQDRDSQTLSYLSHMDGLLCTFVVSAHLDDEDLRQDAVPVILHCLELKPGQKYTLHASISTSVRGRILDNIRYNQSHQAESLDAKACREASKKILADLIPSGYRVDPMLVVLAKEQWLRAMAALRSLPEKRRKTKRVQKAMALFEEEGKL